MSRRSIIFVAVAFSLATSAAIASPFPSAVDETGGTTQAEARVLGHDVRTEASSLPIVIDENGGTTYVVAAAVAPHAIGIASVRGASFPYTPDENGG